jgi:hypothetical protein
VVSWGNWVYGGGNGMRVGIQDYGHAGVDQNSTQFWVSFEIWTQNQYRYNDQQTLSWSSCTAGSLGYNNTGEAQTTAHRHNVICYYTYTSYGASPGQLALTASVSGAYNNVSPFHTLYVTIPGRPAPPPPEYAPYAPTGVTAARNSDVQATVSGTHPVDSQHDVNSMTIQQRSRVDPTWSGYTDVYTGVGTSRAVTGLSPNHIYQFQMRLNNNLGSSAFVPSNEVYMTPAAPDSVSAALIDNQVRLDWVSNAYTSASVTHKVERSVDGAAWTPLVSSLPQATLSYTDTAPVVGANRYRVATVTSNGNLSSAWVESDEVDMVNVDCWLWDGTTEIPLTAYLWDGTTTIPLDLEFIQTRSS